MKIKDDNFAILKKHGFIQSKVASFPQKMVKVVDVNKKYVVEVCNDLPRSRNMWTGEDWKYVGILRLWECKVLDMNYKWRDGEISPYYEVKETRNELLNDYIRDLIDSGIVI